MRAFRCNRDSLWKRLFSALFDDALLSCILEISKFLQISLLFSPQSTSCAQKELQKLGSQKSPKTVQDCKVRPMSSRRATGARQKCREAGGTLEGQKRIGFPARRLFSAGQLLSLSPGYSMPFSLASLGLEKNLRVFSSELSGRYLARVG